MFSKQNKKSHVGLIENEGETIAASTKPYVDIELTKARDLSPWASKVLGNPYLPKNVNIPRSSNNKPLYMLAQINFEEMPRLDPFPTSGLLQFWIASDDLYGLDIENTTKQDGFRILYYPQLINDQDFNDATKSELDENGFYPFLDGTTNLAISYSLDEMPPTLTGYHFEKIFGDRPQHFIDAYATTFADGGHRIGGYADFTQCDPRSESSVLADKEHLLLQIDSDADAGIWWGDGGTANFFISDTDLRQKNFSDVLYTWDCA